MSRMAAGRLVATPGAMALQGVNLRALVERHLTGDWGDAGKADGTTLTPDETAMGCLATGDDAKLNKLAPLQGGRVLSSYATPAGKLWIITDGLEPGGRGGPNTVTTCLLPSEY